MSTIKVAGFRPSSSGKPTGRRLVVVIHGWCGSPKRMSEVVEAAQSAYSKQSGVDFFVPHLPYSHLLSITPAARIVARLLKDMDAICDDKKRYSQIVFVGFSMGAVVARRLYISATGIGETIPSEGELRGQKPRHWASRVERIVALSGVNRGWQNSGRLGWIQSFVANCLAFVGYGPLDLTIFDVRRGAPFIVQTRLQWLALRRSKLRAGSPLVIQLLGSQDSLVAPDDIVDFAVDFGKRYFYIQLPNTTHNEAKVFSPSISDPKGEYGIERRRRFIFALTQQVDALQRLAIPKSFLADTMPSPPDPKVKHVVFVIHGIRDDGYWTRKIAQQIQETAVASGKPVYRCITSSYGYFAMLPFILPWVRRQKVEWLMDEYIGAKAKYPNAEFSYVGHSNGTYMAARALQDYPAAKFRNILFAGSVVRRGYDWDSYYAQGRVQKAMNLVATADWVVALFPSGLAPWRVFDLGGAGFRGFKYLRPRNAILQTEYVVGGHSAGILEIHWQQIADFIVNEKTFAQQTPSLANTQSRLVYTLWLFSPVLLLILFVVFLIAMPVFILWPVLVVLMLHYFWPSLYASVSIFEAALRVAILALYIALIGFIVTRV